METKNNWKAWIYLSPALVLLAIFTFYPMVYTVLLSFFDGYKMTTAIAGTYKYKIGINNYVQVIMNNQYFWQGFWNTTILAIVTVPLSTMLSLLIAVALNSIKTLQKFLQTIFFLPYVTNAIAIGMVFNMIFNVLQTGTTVTDIGLFNRLLGVFGIEPKIWLQVGDRPFWESLDAFWIWGRKVLVLTIYIVWNALPFKIMILLGALQSVNKQYYEAAKVDGTPKSRVFWKITVPLISPMLAYVIITGFIGAFKEYSSVVGIFGEDLNKYGMSTMVGFIYDSIEGVWTGRAAAGAVVLFVLILILTGIQFLVSKKKVHY